MIPKFVSRISAGERPVIFGDGTQTRDFTWVEETAAGIVAAAARDELVGEAVNIAHGSGVSIARVCELLLEVMDAEHLQPEYVDGRAGGRAAPPREHGQGLRGAGLPRRGPDPRGPRALRRLGFQAGPRSARPQNRSRCATGKEMAKRGIDIAPGRRIVILGADGFIGQRPGVRRALAAVRFYGRSRLLRQGSPWRLRGVRGRLGARARNDPRAPGGSGGRLRETLYPVLRRSADAVALLAYQPPPDRLAARRHEHAVNAAGAIGVGEIAVRAGGAARLHQLGRRLRGMARRAGERADPRPQTPYAEAKLEAERLLASRGAPRSVVSLRLATVYGPGENGPRAIPSFINAYLGSGDPVLHGDGTDVKDYVHVDDVAAGILSACLLPSPPPTANLGSGAGRSTEEVLPRGRRGDGPRAALPARAEPASALAADRRRALAARARLRSAPRLRRRPFATRCAGCGTAGKRRWRHERSRCCSRTIPTRRTCGCGTRRSRWPPPATR